MHWYPDWGLFTQYLYELPFQEVNHYPSLFYMLPYLQRVEKSIRSNATRKLFSMLSNGCIINLSRSCYEVHSTESAGGRRGRQIVYHFMSRYHHTYQFYCLWGLGREKNSPLVNWSSYMKKMLLGVGEFALVLLVARGGQKTAYWVFDLAVSRDLLISPAVPVENVSLGEGLLYLQSQS